jgi:hypothetical protein
MDFYKVLVNVTSGIMLPLTMVDLDMECHVCEVGQAIVPRILMVWWHRCC